MKSETKKKTTTTSSTMTMTDGGKKDIKTGGHDEKGHNTSGNDDESGNDATNPNFQTTSYDDGGCGDGSSSGNKFRTSNGGSGSGSSGSGDNDIDERALASYFDIHNLSEDFAREQKPWLSLNRLRYKTAHKKDDMAFLRQNWPGRGTATVSIEDVPSKVQKKFKKTIKAHISGWQDLYSQQREIFLQLNSNTPSSVKLLPQARKLAEKANKSVYTVIPLVDGKLVTDLPLDFRTKSVWDAIKESNYELILAQMLGNWLMVTVLEEKTSANQHETIVDIATRIIEMFPPLSDESPIPRLFEAQVLYNRAKSHYRVGNYEEALIEMRCCGAVIRLLESSEHECDSQREIASIGTLVIPDIMRTLVQLKYRENMQRPFFTVAEINKYEKELGIGIFDKDNYKCHHCGKSRADGKLILCTGCDRAWVCDEECHFTGWKSHKKWCGNDVRWRRNPFCTVPLETYNNIREALVKKIKNNEPFPMYDIHGLKVVFCVDPSTDEIFDAWTDRTFKIKEEKDG